MFKRNRGSPPKFCLNECDGCYFADISTQEHRIRRIRCVQAFTDVASFYSRSATTYKNPIRFFMNNGKMYAKTLIITYAIIVNWLISSVAVALISQYAHSDKRNLVFCNENRPQDAC